MSPDDTRKWSKSQALSCIIQLMIRKSTISLKHANTGKKEKILYFLAEYKVLVNCYIDHLWNNQIFSGMFVKDIPEIGTHLSARIQQCAAKQALAIVKSQRKRRKKTKPKYTRLLANLDSRFVEIKEGSNSFDLWLKLSSFERKVKLWLPSQKHVQFNKFSSWNMKKSIRLYEKDEDLFVDVYFEKEKPTKKEKGQSIGFDIGYKKLLVDSNGKQYGTDFSKIAEKIARKTQGSKAFKRSLQERDEFINRVVKTVDISTVKQIVVEDLKNVKKNSKGKIRKSFNNKLQRWTYPKILKKLEMISEENGVHFLKINPAFTSQTCSLCKTVDKSFRKGEQFRCGKCGLQLDADHNAARNVLSLSDAGAYGPCRLTTDPQVGSEL